MKPVVTVVIPTFNRKKLLGKAIDSCLMQDVDTEIVVIDDGSADGTKEKILDEYCKLLDNSVRPGPLKYFKQENRGVSAARNAGLSMARGTYVKFLDSDDVLIEGTLTREVEFAEKENADVVVTGWRNDYYSDSELVNLVRTEFEKAPHMERGVDDMLLGRAPWTAAALYRRELVKGVKWDVNFNKAEEWLWVWRVFFSGCTFDTLNVTSAVWNHYPSSGRLTEIGDSYDRSSSARNAILKIVQKELERRGELIGARQKLLCQYYYRNAVWAAKKGRGEWRKLYRRINGIVPGFRPQGERGLLGMSISMFGYYRGILLYGSLSSMYSSIRNKWHTGLTESGQ